MPELVLGQSCAGQGGDLIGTLGAVSKISQFSDIQRGRYGLMQVFLLLPVQLGAEIWRKRAKLSRTKR